MPVHSYLVLIGFTFLFMAYVLQFVRLRNSASEFLGNAPFEKMYFYSGKGAIFATWALFIVKAINPRLGYIYLPTALSWIAVVLLFFGIIIVSISLANLGNSLNVGLPKPETTLKTRGIYRISRNPLYIGAHVIAIASCIYFPDLINVSCMVYGIVMHHKIIRQEECFLAERFGKDWLIYSTRVSRYL